MRTWRDAESVLVEERTYSRWIKVSAEDIGDEVYVDNKEVLHTKLASAGFKRVGKQRGSEIGGVYVRPQA